MQAPLDHDIAGACAEPEVGTTVTLAPVVMWGAGAGNLPPGGTHAIDNGISFDGVIPPTEEGRSRTLPKVRGRLNITAVSVGNASHSREVGVFVSSVPSYLLLLPGAR